MNQLDFSDGRFWLDLIQWLVMGVMALLMWLRKPGMDATKAVGELRTHIDERFTSIDKRLSTQEERALHVPSDQEIAELEGELKALRERVNGMGDTLSTIQRAVTRIEDFLLRGARP